MKAILFDQFAGPLRLEDLPEPVPPADGVVIELRATGVCRSDWHGWQGHDPDITWLPHVPGHELAGVVAELGHEVSNWRPGDRVTMPFVAGCGSCGECKAGAPQVCRHQFQPGFTAWGAFAERVAVPYADFNLVALPDELDFVTAASLGCRLGTAYRAVALQGRVAAGDWIAIHGCGGLGLSAVLIATALGGRVVAIDIQNAALALATQFGAEHAIHAVETGDVPAAVREVTAGGADVSLDALGSRVTCANSVRSLRRRGRHVQVGLLAGDDATPPVPMELVVARELELYGSHGIAAADYPPLLDLVTSGRVDPRRLVQRTIALADVPEALAALEQFESSGITIVDRF